MNPELLMMGVSLLSSGDGGPLAKGDEEPLVFCSGVLFKGAQTQLQDPDAQTPFREDFESLGREVFLEM